MTKRVAIYLRVSTRDQNTDNQRRELMAVTKRAGWTVVEVYEDHGISGAKGRDKRPAFDAMLKAVTARQIDMVAAWAIDRLGRSLQHLVAFIEDLRAAGCDLYVHQQHLDTTSPSGRAMFGMCSVFAEFEREMIRERVNAGLARTKAKGTRLGRGSTKDAERWGTTKAVIATKVKALRAQGMGKMKIAKTLGIGTGTVQRILA
ncbi:recombinase family protein [Bradyrhizobium sp. Ec3.3]|uniref:recombinase family protein n=1 Tax=Bradyrhizobium sp. Ec3.3 TaxID=189753 RepID=UPI000422DEE9|nr:recombinase family protein [Bradyrhizobium sp. Ec3.3]